MRVYGAHLSPRKPLRGTVCLTPEGLDVEAAREEARAVIAAQEAERRAALEAERAAQAEEAAKETAKIAEQARPRGA